LQNHRRFVRHGSSNGGIGYPEGKIEESCRQGSACVKNGLPEQARACVILPISVKSLVGEDSIEKSH
jgi:hypothetical protein